MCCCCCYCCYGAVAVVVWLIFHPFELNRNNTKTMNSIGYGTACFENQTPHLHKTKKKDSKPKWKYHTKNTLTHSINHSLTPTRNPRKTQQTYGWFLPLSKNILSPLCAGFFLCNSVLFDLIWFDLYARWCFFLFNETISSALYCFCYCYRRPLNERKFNNDERKKQILLNNIEFKTTRTGFTNTNTKHQLLVDK